MIEFRDISKNFDSFEAVKELSFTAREGMTTVLIGPSGCGKTTSLRMVNRLTEPSAGEILVDGQPVKSFVPELLRRKIGYVIQSVGLFPHMTVGENIAIVPRLIGWKPEKRRKRAEELLDLIGLDPAQYIDKHPDELSGGEAQRIGVARALAADPPFLLMDEPFGAVDPINRESLQVEFNRLQARLKKTVLFVTHDIDEAVRVGDSVVLLREGRFVQQDTPERLLAAPANHFVREFLGNDRALKRLSCFKVKDYMRPGGEERSYGEGALTASASRERSVGETTTVRDALSKILGLGLKRLSVTDERGEIVGTIHLADIEELNQSGAEL